jgi:PAS domain S-box-containing protein
MKKNQTFSRYIFLVLLVLESLTLVVVVGVLHAMLVKSMDGEEQNHIDAHRAEFRLFLKDRHEHAQARLDDLSVNNGIKVALLLGLQDKVTEVVTSLYPPANGVTYYIRGLSGSLIPKPAIAHQFLDNMELADVADVAVNTKGADTTMTVFSRSIIRKGKLVGQAIVIYDLADDQYLNELQKTFKECRLLRNTAEGLCDLSDGHSILLDSDQKQKLGSNASPLLAADMLIMPLEGFRHVYFAIDTQHLDAKKRKLLMNIVLLCIPLLGLALAASYMILQKVTLPLNALAEDARQITNGASAHYPDEKKIKPVEFLDLTKVFNKALTHISQRNDQLLRLNQSLQDEIFERKQLGNALVASEKQLRSLQDNIPIGLFRTTPEGRIIYANPACLNIFGSKDIAGFQAVDTNDLYEHKADRQKILAQLSATGSLERCQVRLRRKDGSLFWALLYISRVTESNSGETYLDGTIQDISLQVKAENEKQQLEAQLQQSQKMETIGTLAGGIAHDFNNLLASIKGYTELVLEDSQPETIQEENLNYILVATQRATDLVSQILTFARQTDTEKKPIQVKQVFAEALKLVRSTLPSTIKIRKNMQSNSAVLAASTQLHQVIVNLCSNAGHAMQESGGVLTIELTDIEPGTTYEDPNRLVKAGPHVQLTIADTGHGIAPEILRRIFDPYYTTKKPGEGTGIGLSVVQGIVRSHGGFITVDSKQEQGTCFKVFLPIFDRENIPQAVSSTQIVGGNERILLVDDELLVLQMGHQMLERLGYQVTARSSSLEAFELFEKASDQFDLVITDMTMPDLTGDRLAKRISDIRPDVPIILLTGHSNRLDHKKLAEAGVKATLHKPLVKKDLASTIRNAIISV